MRRILGSIVFASCVLVLAPLGRADDAQCAREIEYDVTADVKITDTPMGEGDGVFPVGPGKIVLRFEGNSVKMTKYTTHEHVTLRAKNLAWTTTIVSDTNTTATPDACGVLAEGTLDASHVVRWRTPVHGVKTDGTITCSGSFCGKFGAPPRGQSAFHDGPIEIRYSPFVMGPDEKTFTMQMTHMSQTTSPKQTTAMALAGREAKRVCVPAPACTH